MSENIHGVTIPDDLFDTHFGEDEDADTMEAEDGPGAEDELPEDDEADTPEEDDESDADPAEEDDDTGESDDDEDEEAEEEAEPEEESPFDRKELEAIEDPKARKVAERALKGFQSAFTKKTQEMATFRKTAEKELAARREWEEGVKAELADIETQEGGEALMLKTVANRPGIFTETVLTDLALANPEAFAAAYERAMELAEDPKAKRVFEGERKLKVKEHEDGRSQASAAQQEAAQREARLAKLVEGEASKAGIRRKESLELVRDSVDALLMKASRTGRQVTADDIRAHVATTSKRLLGERKEAAKAAEQQARVDQQKRVKATASAAKERRAPVPRGAAPKRSGDFKAPENNRNLIGSMVDHFFGS